MATATLKDVYEAYDSLKIGAQLFGATSEWLAKFNELAKIVCDAVMEEQSLDDFEKATALPDDTVLGKKAQAALEELKTLLEQW